MWDSRDTTTINPMGHTSQLSFYEYPPHKPYVNSTYQPLRPSQSLSRTVALPESNRDQLLTALQTLSLKIKTLENEREVSSLTSSSFLTIIEKYIYQYISLVQFEVRSNNTLTKMIKDIPMKFHPSQLIFREQKPIYVKSPIISIVHTLVVLICMGTMIYREGNCLMELMNIDHESREPVERRNEHINIMAVLIQQRVE